MISLRNALDMCDIYWIHISKIYPKYIYNMSEMYFYISEIYQRYSYDVPIHEMCLKYA